MKISLGNAIYNHKPTHNDMVWHSGFLNKRKEPISCPVREDTVENYAFAYDNGLCVKGYRFCSEADIWKRTFVCDFDNLTEAQYRKVIELVESGSLKRIQGRMSSGMKIDWFQHEGIPEWKPTKWKYKVFFPLDEYYGNNGVMCVREEVERAYLDVVQFFNDWSERSKTEEVARLWLKANNQSMFYKHGKNKGLLRNNHPALVVEDPIFKDYILPDPVEVTNPRHQITYSVVPEMKEAHRFLKDEDWKQIMGSEMVARFPATTKAHFTDIIDLPYDFKDSMEKHVRRTTDRIEDNHNPSIYKRVHSALTGDTNNRKVPTSKSEMARRSRKHSWDDLVFDVKLAAKTNKAIYSNWEDGYDMEKVSSTFCDIVRFLVRCEAELENGVNGKPARDSVVDNVLEDLPWYSTHVFGETFIQNMSERTLKRLVQSIGRTIEKSCDSYRIWRWEQKCLKLMEARPDLKERWNEARRNLGRTADFKTYYKEKMKLEESVVNEAKETSFPYVYVRRGLKKEMVDQALKSGKPMSKEMFVGFVLERISTEDGVVEREKVDGWFRDYQSQFNKSQAMATTQLDMEIYGQMNGYRLRKGIIHKEHKSKWSELFKDKSQDEISDIIDNLEVSKQMKYKLRRQYGR